MTTFDDREKAFENLYAHDRDLAFMAESKRNKVVGLWAAALLGRFGGAADAYAEALVSAGVLGGSGEPVLRRLLADFEAAGVSVSESALRERLMAELAAALEHLKRD